jgi:hypothetical protein
MARTRRVPTAAAALAALQTQVQSLWPVAKGSLSRVRKPCIRPACRACASGEKHPVWLYTFRLDGRRRCVYVAEAQVAALRQALANGRQVERLLCQCGEAIARHGLDAAGAVPERRP